MVINTKGKINAYQLSDELVDRIYDDSNIKGIPIPQTTVVSYMKIASFVNNASDTHSECFVFASSGFTQGNYSGLLRMANKLQWMQLSPVDSFFEIGQVVSGTNTDIWVKITPYISGNIVIMDNTKVTYYKDFKPITAMPTNYKALTKDFLYSSLNPPTLKDLGGMSEGPLSWNEIEGIADFVFAGPYSWQQFQALDNGNMVWDEAISTTWNKVGV